MILFQEVQSLVGESADAGKAISLPGLRVINQRSARAAAPATARTVAVETTEDECRNSRREPLMEA